MKTAEESLLAIGVAASKARELGAKLTPEAALAFIQHAQADRNVRSVPGLVVAMIERGDPPPARARPAGGTWVEPPAAEVAEHEALAVYLREERPDLLARLVHEWKCDDPRYGHWEPSWFLNTRRGAQGYPNSLRFLGWARIRLEKMLQ